MTPLFAVKAFFLAIVDFLGILGTFAGSTSSLRDDPVKFAKLHITFSCLWNLMKSVRGD